jgi:abortive infection bacteriophage resistance protein
MALDIEHHTKLQLLRKMDDNNEDGYQVIQDYIASLDERQKSIFDSEINRNKGNIYCGDIIDKYDRAFPIWAFVEIVPFGRLVSFYGFCADRFSDKTMKDNFYRLLTCKEIRNASAHSNCILNDLRSKTAAHGTNAAVTKELMTISGMNSNFRKNRMSNARIQQVITLLYMHKIMVGSDGIRKSECEELRKVANRVDKNIDYYKDNSKIKGTLYFLKMVVDSWFKNE